MRMTGFIHYTRHGRRTVPPSHPVRQLLIGISAVGVMLVVVAVGHHVIEGWTYFDGLYMTVTTVMTVGFSEVHPLSVAGRVFTIVLILTGVATWFYALGNVVRFLLEGELRAAVGQHRLEGHMRALSEHYIVCGYGRMGKRICKELGRRSLPIVVIEKKGDAIAEAQRDGWLVVEGDATEDQVLMEAGADRAKALVATVGTDADNLYIVLTARGLNNDLHIVARAGEEGSEQKLLRAGANRVSSPYQVGGTQVAQALLRPAVVDFLELATQSEHLDVQIEEFTVPSGSRFDDQEASEYGLEQDRGLILVAVQRRSGHLEFNPGVHVRLKSGDKLIVLGQQASLKRLETMVKA